MKIIKKYTAIQLGTETVNENVNVKLSFGQITGAYYDRQHPEEEFNTEDEAIEHAYKYYKHATWLIIPIVRFDTSNEKY